MIVGEHEQPFRAWKPTYSTLKMEKKSLRKHKSMKNNIKNNKEGALQGIRVMTTRRGCRKENNESNEEEITKMKIPRVINKIKNI